MRHLRRVASRCNPGRRFGRLLACGRAPAEVAAELGITRQALWKWRRRADFDAGVFRLHECLTWTAGATAAKRR